MTGAPQPPARKSAGHPERASERVVLKFKPAELQEIDQAASAKGMKRAPFIKLWMAAVVRRIEEEA